MAKGGGFNAITVGVSCDNVNDGGFVSGNRPNQLENVSRERQHEVATL